MNYVKMLFELSGLYIHGRHSGTNENFAIYLNYSEYEISEFELSRGYWSPDQDENGRAMLVAFSMCFGCACTLTGHRTVIENRKLVLDAGLLKRRD
ncbi:unnamed protein product [Ixodes persulcatus]